MTCHPFAARIHFLEHLEAFGIVIGKLIYGGSGRYLLSPALLGMAFLMFSYPSLLFGIGAWVPVAGYDQHRLSQIVDVPDLPTCRGRKP